MRTSTSRRITPPEGYEDINIWPDVDESLLEESLQLRFSSLKQAVRSYFIGKNTLKKIKTDTGVPESEVVRQAKRCIETHPDGKIWGYRALVKYIHVDEFTRHKEINDNASKFGGYAGAFTQLLDTYPKLKKLIDDRILKKIKKGRIKVGKVQLKQLKNDFIKECKILGITGYPVDREEKGGRALLEYIKQLKLDNMVSAARVFQGEDIAMVISNTGKGEIPELLTRPFQRVECDEHRDDSQGTLAIPLTGGGYKYVPLTRISIVINEECKSTAVIGYSIVLNEHVSKLDIHRAIARCFEKQPRKAFITPELNKIEGGLPVDLIPGLEWVAWDELAFDRALVHKAKSVKNVLRKKIGCSIVMGKPHTAVRRPYIERFNGMLEEKLHQLPNTVGSHPKDPCKKNPEKYAEMYGITITEIIEILEACIAEYNVDSDRPSLAYRSPIEFLRQDMEKRIDTLLPYRKIPPNYQSKIEIIGQTYFSTIKNSGGKIRPHINFLYVRYTSDILAQNPDLVNHKIKIVVDPDDIRFVHAYLPNGQSLGILQARGQWGIIPHSIENRKDYYSKKNKKLRKNVNDDNAVSVYLLSLVENSKTSRREADHLAMALKTLVDKWDDPIFSESMNSNKQLRRPNYNNIDRPPRRATKILHKKIP